MDFEEYLEANFKKRIIDHKIRVDDHKDGHPKFYIHADGKDSETLDFKVMGNELVPVYSR
jgi:hypothetical protein